MILNKTRKPHERYRIIQGSMGCYGLPPEHISHKYHIVAGIDRGYGYQDNMSIEFFLRQKFIPFEAKRNLTRWLKSQGYDPITLCKQETL